MEEFWQDLALDLLEKNLNGDSLNSSMIKEMFASQPHILEQLDFGDVDSIDEIDQKLYGSQPNFIEIREAKPTEVFHCVPCNRTFKRSDNMKRHLLSALHARRQRAYELAAQEKRDDSPGSPAEKKKTVKTKNARINTKKN